MSIRTSAIAELPVWAVLLADRPHPIYRVRARTRSEARARAKAHARIPARAGFLSAPSSSRSMIVKHGLPSKTPGSPIATATPRACAARAWEHAERLQLLPDVGERDKQPVETDEDARDLDLDLDRERSTQP